MLYLDYSRGPGQWHPNVHGGRENLEAIAFLQEANATAYRRTPGVMMIAEESTAWPGVTRPTSAGGLGFGLKWNMGWMNDSLRYVAEEPINRRYHHHEITFSMVYAYSEQFVLPISHDEVVHGKGSLYGKMPGDDWQKRAGVRAFLAYQWSHPGKQLLFMGSEIGQHSEWNEGRSLDWDGLAADPGRQGVQRAVRDLNALYRATPALWELDHDPAGFEWLDADDADHNVLAYVRRGRDGSEVAVVVNFAGTPHEGYRVALPSGGAWRRSSTPTRRSTAAPASATSARSRRSPCRGRDARSPRPCASLRWARCTSSRRRGRGLVRRGRGLVAEVEVWSPRSRSGRPGWWVGRWRRVYHPPLVPRGSPPGPPRPGATAPPTRLRLTLALPPRHHASRSPRGDRPLTAAGHREVTGRRRAWLGCVSRG